MKNNTLNKFLLGTALCLFVFSTNSSLLRHYNSILNDVLSVRYYGLYLLLFATVAIAVFFWREVKWAKYLVFAVSGLGFIYATYFGYIRDLGYDSITVQQYYTQIMARGYFLTLVTFVALGVRLFMRKSVDRK